MSSKKSIQINLILYIKKDDKKIGKLIEDITERIHGNPVQGNLIMEMGSGGTAGFPNKSYLLTTLNMLPLFNQSFFKMRISRYQAVTVVDS